MNEYQISRVRVTASIKYSSVSRVGSCGSTMIECVRVNMQIYSSTKYHHVIVEIDESESGQVAQKR